uniref:E3 ubiquitin-protein ligase RGLG2 n=1 Tax=Cajanus cajan TaxID=3821 RepID=A0A151R3H4_CAJCA|nr:E3 ubiquitin-protein ligase RGLG2 [Cajanus cajan]
MKDPINKVLYLEDEAARSSNIKLNFSFSLVIVRNEALLLQSELEDWKKRANFAKERWQSLKKESNHQLLKLKNERESISDAEKKACSVIRSLHERLKHLQHECAKLNKELQEEHKRSQFLTVEYDKSHEAAQIAKREVEAVRQVLQEERENAQRIMENFRRDVIFAESRAAFAEVLIDISVILFWLVPNEYFLFSFDWKGNLMNDGKFTRDLFEKCLKKEVCSICLCNEKDLAFGCGHMTCRECGLKLSKCHICREQITNHIKLFPG